MLRSTSLLSLLLLVACNGGGSSGGASSQSVTTLGGLTADPARSLAYATDAGTGKVHTLNLRTGLVERSRSFLTTTGAVAADPAGRRLVVALPDDHRLAVLRLPELEAWNTLRLEGAPHALTWLGGDDIAAIVGDRVLRIDVRTGETEQLERGASQRCQLRHDPFSGRLFLLDQCNLAGEPDQLHVRCLALKSDDPGRPPVCTTSGPLNGRALDLHSGWSGRVILVAASGIAGTYVLDAETLAVVDVLPGPAEIVAARFNATGTRLYQASRDSSIRDVDLDRFQSRLEAFPVARVSDLGMLMPEDGLHLVTHLEDTSIAVQRPFELQLIAHPLAEIGLGWELELQGPPGMSVRVFVATEPGYLHLSSSQSEKPLLMDLHLDHTRYLAQVELGPDGHVRGHFAVPKSELLVDQRFILQAVGRDPATGGLLEVSNPLVVSTRVFPPER